MNVVKAVMAVMSTALLLVVGTAMCMIGEIDMSRCGRQ